jgi:MinD superfamily P-loop ATPase
MGEEEIRIAIASGKGGTGKTFLSVNLFYSLQRQKQDAILIDCDAEAPNAVAFFDTEAESSDEVTQLVPVIDTEKCTYCGKCHEYCNYNAIFILPPSRIIRVIEDLCHGCGACSVACTFGAISEKPVALGKVGTYSEAGNSSIIEARMNIGVLSPVPVIKAAIKKAGGHRGVVILDSPPGTSCPFIQTVSAADYVILVTEPTPFGLSDLKQSVETLKKIDKPFGVVINRSGFGYDDVTTYLKTEKIPLLLEIPFRMDYAGMYSRGEIVAAADPYFAEQLDRMMGTITDIWK